jgi:carbon starvation protein
VLPVWLLLQPRDYVNSHQLFVGVAFLIAGIMVAQPTITAPAFNVSPPADAPSWFPFLFVTIACGAISGFHGLVSSGTTSKQLACATDARLVGYGGMIGEGVLALIATLAVSAGLADWAGHYHSFGAAAKNGVINFVEGAGSFLVALGLPQGPAEIVVAVLVISFAATTLDTGVRIQRYILHEIGEAYRIPPLKNRFVAAGVAVIIPTVVVLAGKAAALWPLFGSSNQLLAGLSLTVVTIWLYRSGRAWLHVGIPMLLVLGVSAMAMLGNLMSYWRADNYLLLVLGTMVLALQAWVVGEGVVAVRSARRQKAELPDVRVAR